MHSARGGWLGQTYALAKFDDSFEGKKSRIQRSKEERKGMIETFIKRYQKSNNGDFPSLNLTRKEVGGSFYTVREIVREIIQENRVLGPPKSPPPQDQNMENVDSFLEYNPLGSMSIDHHVDSLPPKDVQTLHEYAFISENVINTSSINELHQGKMLHNDNIVDGSMNKTEKSEKSIDQVNELVANQTQKHQILEDVQVVDGDLEEKGTENRELPIDVVDIKSEESKSKSTLAGQKGHNHSSAKENLAVDVNGNTDVKLVDALPAEEKTINGANSHNNLQHSTLIEKSANSNKSGGNSQKRKTNATLNRINLSESWKAVSKNPNGRETHRFVTFIKAFITAFVKFWSE